MQNTLLGALRGLTPRMAGTNFRDRTIACLGALIGIGITGLISGWAVGNLEHLPLLVAPLGASAVLLFAVPASPLAQPWSIIGGNTISALVGIAIAHLVPDKAIGAAIAVAAAIAVMSLLRCLHPPGGAASLLGVLGGPAAASWSFGFRAGAGGAQFDPAGDPGPRVPPLLAAQLSAQAQGGDGSHPRHRRPAAAAAR